jgi:outer membrane protein assembly factor BamB
LKAINLLSLILISSSAMASEVAQYRTDPQHTGVSQAANITANPYIKWRFKTGNKVRSTAVVLGDVLVVGSDDGQVYALNASTGALKWAFRTGGRVASSPAIADGAVYFESGDLRVYAVDLATGKLRWKSALGAELPSPEALPLTFVPAEYGLWDYYLSSPTVAGNAIYIGGGDGNLYALDLRTGKSIWTFPAHARIRSAPAVASNVVYVATMAGELFAVDAATGKERWKFKVEGNQYFPSGGIQSSPTVTDGLVIFGSRDFNVYAVQVADGKLRWKYLHKDSWVITPPTVSQGLVYMGSSDGRFVDALDVKTGEEKWRDTTSGNVFGAIAISGDIAISADWDGKVVWRNAKTGKTLGGFIFEDRINSSPVISGDTLFIGADDDYITAIGFKPVENNSK